MAQGDVVGAILNVAAPGPTYARADPSTLLSTTTAENNPRLQFDDTTPETYDLFGSLNRYGGGGVNVQFVVSTVGTPSTTTDWEASFRRLNNGHNISGAGGYVFQPGTAPQPGGANQLQYFTIAFSNAQMDGLQDGERFVLRVNRNPPDGQAGDMSLWWPLITIIEQ